MSALADDLLAVAFAVGRFPVVGCRREGSWFGSVTLPDNTVIEPDAGSPEAAAKALRKQVAAHFAAQVSLAESSLAEAKRNATRAGGEA